MPLVVPLVHYWPSDCEAVQNGHGFTERAKDFPRWVDENMVPFVTPDVSPGIRNWVREMALWTSVQALVESNRAITGADFRAALPTVAVPTLVVHGDQDATSPLDLTGRATAALVPGVRLMVYQGAPHGLFLTHRDRLNADLLAFTLPGTIACGELRALREPITAADEG